MASVGSNTVKKLEHDASEELCELDLDQISRCTNVSDLFHGINRDLNVIEQKQHQQKLRLTGEGEANTGVVDGDLKRNTYQSHEPHSIDLGTTSSPSTEEFLAGGLSRVKTLLYNSDPGDNSNSDQRSKDGPSNIARAVMLHMVEKYPNLLPRLLDQISLPSMPFEARKDVSAIFNHLLVVTSRYSVDECQSVDTATLNSPANDASYSSVYVKYIDSKYKEIMIPIVKGHESPDTALHCGSMLRSTLRHPILYQRLLCPNEVSKFFYPLLDVYVHLPNFDIASDALVTIRDIIIRDRGTAAEFLEREYCGIFTRYNVMLRSENYITRRMSLTLLGEILLDRSNYHVMIKYISTRENLTIIMLLLRDPSSIIQFEAFHVFKIFVANPNKPAEVIKILALNKVKLVAYLENFHSDKENGDDQFRDEKALVVTALKCLEEAL